LETIWLNISAGSGPEECAKMAALTLRTIQQEIQEKPERGLKVSVIELHPARESGNIRSVLLTLEGKNAGAFADSWTGVIQWIWQSSYRPNHKRKNWFVQVFVHTEPQLNKLLSPNEVRYETARAGGPGGQHVNKTETAVRAVHIPTGKNAVAREERSQLMNKRLAYYRLIMIFEKEKSELMKKSKSDLRHNHWELERGNPIRVYDGLTLKLIRKNHGKNKH